MKRSRGEGEVDARARTTRVLELYCGVGAMHFALRRVTAHKTDVVGDVAAVSAVYQARIEA
jgi:hypothetical protein